MKLAQIVGDHPGHGRGRLAGLANALPLGPEVERTVHDAYHRPHHDGRKAGRENQLREGHAPLSRALALSLIHI